MPEPRPKHITPIGIDLSKDTFESCLKQADGSYRSRSFANQKGGFEGLLQWIDAHTDGPIRIGIEATGPYTVELLHFLSANDRTVALLNPRHAKDFARSLGSRVKTDKVDAKLIARFIESVEPRSWTPCSHDVSKLQALMRRRAQLVDAKQAAANRLHSRRRASLGEPCPALSSIEREIRFFDEELQSIDVALADLLKRSVSLETSERLLRTIPGIGRIVALTILSEIPFITSFGRAREVAAFAGLTPALKQSGTSLNRRGHLTKEGSRALRKQLYMAALNVVRRDNALRATYEAMVERGKPKMVALCATMHRLLRISFGVLKHQSPFVPSFTK